MSADRRGRLGSIVQLLFAAIISMPSWLTANPTPEALPRGLVLMLAYGLPGLVGYLGATRRSRALLAAAALADLPGLVLSFTGVTLIFLIPAILMAAAAIEMPGRARGPQSRGDAATGLVVALLLAGLIVGAGAAMLFVTRPLCWITTQGPGGTSIELVPTINDVPMSMNQSAGCNSGAITFEGVGLGLVQGLVAVGLAAAWTRRRPQPGEA